jgi:hypothetical protein
MSKRIAQTTFQEEPQAQQHQMAGARRENVEAFLMALGEALRNVRHPAKAMRQLLVVQIILGEEEGVHEV